jgi:hypothetical protein
MYRNLSRLRGLQKGPILISPQPGKVTVRRATRFSRLKGVATRRIKPMENRSQYRAQAKGFVNMPFRLMAGLRPHVQLPLGTR